MKVGLFDSEIGIPNVNQSKKERMVVDEVNANNVDTYTKALLWLDELKKGCNKTNKLFGTNISVKLRNFGVAMKNVESENENKPSKKEGEK